MQVKAKDLHQRSLEQAADKTRRLKAKENQRVLREQMAEKMHRDCIADTIMTNTEQKLNKPLLQEAQESVGTARPMAISFV